MTTLTINPSASAHDAWEAGTNVMTLTGEVRITAATAWGGLFLPNVTIPAGSTINSATVYYEASATTHDDPVLTWWMQNADTAAVFSTTNGDITGRPRTTANASDSATGIGNTAYRSVNITTLAAEVVARGGWASGNNMALLLDGGTGIDLWIRSYDTGGDIWYVEFDYTAPSSGAWPRVARSRLSTKVGGLLCSI